MTPEELGGMIKEGIKKILLSDPNLQEPLAQGVINSDFINNSLIVAQSLLLEDKEISQFFKAVVTPTVPPQGSVNTLASRKELIIIAEGIIDRNKMLGGIYAKGFFYGNNTNYSLSTAITRNLDNMAQLEKNGLSANEIVSMFKEGFIAGRDTINREYKNDVYEGILTTMEDQPEKRADIGR